jgi:hypothetical protein
VDSKVRYTERGKKFEGTVKGIAQVEENFPHGDFVKQIHLIEFEGEQELFLRLGYYGKDKGTTEEAYLWSDRPMIIPKENFFKLLKEAINEGIFTKEELAKVLE